MRPLIFFILLVLASPLSAATYYIRTDGGTNAQCNGLVDAPYTTGSDCAWNHPFEALPPGGQARISGGDTLIVGNGSYRMGNTVGTYDTGSCNPAWPWDCHMLNIPSGTEGNPTKLLGAEYATGCRQKPELYGVERTNGVIYASSDYVEIQCLEVTDHDQCIKGHGATGPTEGKIACPTSYPYGEWALRGIIANGADNLLIKNVEIHGVSNDGIYSTSGGSNWTLESVSVHHNGLSGWDGGSFTGSMQLVNTSFSYNGCGETYPGGETIGCWSQNAGGYGDAMGMARTGGDWTITDCSFLYNTSDGIDLLYHDETGSVTINRVHSEGNAGNQIKISGLNNSIKNSVMVGNCAYFEDQSFNYAVDNCRALGHPLVMKFQQAGTTDIVNTSLYSEGDGLIVVSESAEGCNGTEVLTIRNMVGIGDIDYHQPTELSAYLWNECTGITIDHDYEYLYNTKNELQATNVGTDLRGANSIYGDPKIIRASTASEIFDLRLQETSPAINGGLPVGTTVGILQVPSIDYFKTTRSLADIGMFESIDTVKDTPVIINIVISK